MKKSRSEGETRSTPKPNSPATDPFEMIQREIQPTYQKIVPLLVFTNDIEGLAQALVSNTTHFAEWGLIEARAKAKLDEASDHVKTLYGDLYQQFQVVPVNGKTPTVEHIKAIIQQSPRYLQALQAERDAQELANIAMVARQSFSQRLTAIVEATRLVRSELDAGLATRVATAEKRMTEVFGDKEE